MRSDIAKMEDAMENLFDDDDADGLLTPFESNCFCKIERNAFYVISQILYNEQTNEWLCCHKWNWREESVYL